MRLSVALVAVLALAACSQVEPPAAAPAASTGPDPATLGTISGRVTLAGTAPAAELVRIDSDPACVTLAGGATRRGDEIVGGDGHTLPSVFVYVKEGLPPRMYPVPSTPAVLDQQQCRYVPRVLGVQVGQPLAIRNSDPLLHNVRAEGAINETFDVGTPVQGMELTRTFATREVMVPVKCNVHPWMRAYIGVLEHPFFAVTDADGRFTIPQLPAGSYTIETWHERFGTATRQVTVTAGGAADLAVVYEAP